MDDPLKDEIEELEDPFLSGKKPVDPLVDEEDLDPSVISIDDLIEEEEDEEEEGFGDEDEN